MVFLHVLQPPTIIIMIGPMVLDAFHIEVLAASE
jgi:hypothetical protein